MKSFWEAMLGMASDSPISHTTSPKDRNSVFIFPAELFPRMLLHPFTSPHLLPRVSGSAGQSGLELEWTTSEMNNSQVLSCIFFFKLDMNIMVKSYATLDVNYLFAQCIHFVCPIDSGVTGQLSLLSD